MAGHCNRDSILHHVATGISAGMQSQVTGHRSETQRQNGKPDEDIALSHHSQGIKFWMQPALL